MISNTELRIKGLNVLNQMLGSVEAERFIALIIREPFDYTQWQKKLWNDVSIEELSAKAMNSITKP